MIIQQMTAYLNDTLESDIFLDLNNFVVVLLRFNTQYPDLARPNHDQP